MISYSHFMIRPIEAQDKEPLQAGLLMLSNESRRHRFFSSRKNFTEKELKFFTEVDQVNHLAFVAINMDQFGPSPAGSIRSVRDVNRPEFAELAVTIIDLYQGQGLGFKMLEVLADAAKKQNITHFFGDFQTSNTGILKLLEKYCRVNNLPKDAFKLKHVSDGFLYFEMALA